MAAKLEYDYIDQNTDTQRWYEETLHRMEEINRFVSPKGHGRSFYTVTTHDGRSFKVHIIEARDFALYLRAPMSDLLPLSKVAGIFKDSAAEKEFNSIVSEVERDEYQRKWHHLGSRWVPRGALS